MPRIAESYFGRAGEGDQGLGARALSAHLSNLLPERTPLEFLQELVYLSAAIDQLLSHACLSPRSTKTVRLPSLEALERESQSHNGEAVGWAHDVARE